jgi:DNA-binding NtrC family response regulator
MKTKVLVVEDSREQLIQITKVIELAGFEAHTVTSLSAAEKALASTAFPIVLTDIHLTASASQTSYEGLTILENLQLNYPETLALCMSADPKIDTHTKANKLGALHFYRKPILSPDEFVIGVRAAQNLLQAKREGQAKETIVASSVARLAPDGFLIDLATRELAKKVAQSKTIPAVIFGETGTGKEELAKLIHRCRKATEGAIPFVAVNCANLTGDLAASMLFGHKKGAFTGATETTVGFVGEAHKGILFLDEVHTLSMSCQQRLLRVLNDGTFERVGETRSQYSEFQVIVASTRDLDEEVESGQFLVDLRMRLTGVDFQLPPLRERKQDLPALVELILSKEGIGMNANEIQAVVEACASLVWRGNIRQLCKVLQTSATLASLNNEKFRAEHLVNFLEVSTKKPQMNKNPSSQNSDSGSHLDVLLTDSFTLEQGHDEFEKLKIQASIKLHKELEDAANALGISKGNLQKKIRAIKP